jgi:hypothetical protein
MLWIEVKKIKHHQQDRPSSVLVGHALRNAHRKLHFVLNAAQSQD